MASKILNTARTLYAENDAGSMREAVGQAMHAHASAAFHPTNLIGKTFGFGSFVHTMARRSKMKMFGEPTYEPGGIKNPFKSDLKGIGKGRGGRSTAGVAIEAEQAVKAGRTDVVMLKTLGKVEMNTDQTVSYLAQMVSQGQEQIAAQTSVAQSSEELAAEAAVKDAKFLAALKGLNPSDDLLRKMEKERGETRALGPFGGLLGNLGVGMEMAGGAALGGMLGPLLLRAIPPVAIAALVGKGVWDGLNKWEETGNFGDAIYAALDSATLGIVSSLANLFAAAADKFWKNNKQDIMDILGVSAGKIPQKLLDNGQAKVDAAAKAKAAAEAAKPVVKPAAPVKAEILGSGILGSIAAGAGYRGSMGGAGNSIDATTVAPVAGPAPALSSTKSNTLSTANGGELKIRRSADTTNLKAGLMDKVKVLQGQFPKNMTITSGHRDATRNANAGGAKKSQHLHGNAVDIKFNGTKEETIEFVNKASAMGFTGIGVYGPGFVHLDMRKDRAAWGPGKRTRATIPDWAKPALDAHLGRKSAAAPMPTDPTADYSRMAHTQAAQASAIAAINPKQDVSGLTAIHQNQARALAAATAGTQEVMAERAATPATPPSNVNVMAGGGASPITAEQGLSKGASDGLDDIIAKVLIAMGAVSAT